MKSLADYINESFKEEIFESKYKYVYFKLSDESVIEDIKDYCVNKSIYVENISDNKFKIKFYPEYDLTKIINILSKYSDQLEEDNQEEKDYVSEKINELENLFPEEEPEEKEHEEEPEEKDNKDENKEE